MLDSWWGRDGQLYATAAACASVNEEATEQVIPPTVWRFEDQRWQPADDTGVLSARDLPSGELFRPGLDEKYNDELRERATRLAVEARRDPASAAEAIQRIARSLGVHPEALRTWVKKARPTPACGRARPTATPNASPRWNGRIVSYARRTRS